VGFVRDEEKAADAAAAAAAAAVVLLHVVPPDRTKMVVRRRRDEGIKTPARFMLGNRWLPVCLSVQPAKKTVQSMLVNPITDAAAQVVCGASWLAGLGRRGGGGSRYNSNNGCE